MAKELRVIIFEDDPALAALLQRVLLHDGHEVQFFTTPIACPIYSDHDAHCPQGNPCADVIITDFLMPGMTGLDFLKLQRKRGCKTRDKNKVLITGSELTPDMMSDIKTLGCHFIKKPFSMFEMLGWVDECAKRVHIKQPTTTKH